jgi:hypothetical protein
MKAGFFWKRIPMVRPRVRKSAAINIILRVYCTK